MTNITKTQAETLYKTIKFMHDTFTKYKITYWITGGTLLGAIRHGGLIPWDDDGDVCILDKDVPKLRKLTKYFKKHGYLLEDGDPEDPDNSDCINVKNSCDWMVSSNKRNSLGVDIFVMEKKRDRISFKNPYWKVADNGGKKCDFLTKYVYPLVPMYFGNYYVYVPNNSIEHLNRCYGSDWNNMIQMAYNHRTGKWSRSKPKKMKTSDYGAIKPPKSTATKKIPPIITK